MDMRSDYTPTSGLHQIHFRFGKCGGAHLLAEDNTMIWRFQYPLVIKYGRGKSTICKWFSWEKLGDFQDHPCLIAEWPHLALTPGGNTWLTCTHGTSALVQRQLRFVATKLLKFDNRREDMKLRTYGLWLLKSRNHVNTPWFLCQTQISQILHMYIFQCVYSYIQIVHISWCDYIRIWSYLLYVNVI